MIHSFNLKGYIGKKSYKNKILQNSYGSFESILILTLSNISTIKLTFIANLLYYIC